MMSALMLFKILLQIYQSELQFFCYISLHFSKVIQKKLKLLWTAYIVKYVNFESRLKFNLLAPNER